MRSPDFGIVAGLAILVLLCASLPYMSIGRRVITAVTFHEVHGTPHTQTSSQSNHQSLQNVHCTVKKFHSKISFGLKKATLHTSEIHLLKRRKLRRELIYWCTYGSNCVYCESELAEQTGQQGHQSDTDQGNAAASHQLFYPQLGVKLCSMAGGGVQKIYMVFFREPSRRDRSGSDLFHLRDGFEIKMNFDRNVSCFIFVNAFMHDDFFD